MFPATVAEVESVTVKLLGMATMVAPAGIPGPVTVWPKVSPLESGTVTVLPVVAVEVRETVPGEPSTARKPSVVTPLLSEVIPVLQVQLSLQQPTTDTERSKVSGLFAAVACF